ncbi:leucine-rich repeat domain-containing protein [Catalinimonas niigatensis]|uniref:leucine-rich repeat domain-containing protein n=1 Tax=Catalinimonas niigatensis TaxID=1397264 RepID=UPI002666AE25|nr:leucine-rich repeat domain-containing protein [Catalinimonas niigatensis]WPP51050.1 leucine-rich repeat domain-containing protein [Catalinimonas niigatensis]
MRKLKLYFAVCSLSLVFILIVNPSYAQSQPRELSTEQVDEYKEQATQMVSFLQSMMNILGSNNATTQQKEIVINQSYSKAFKDANVQIEDDLDDDRVVVTNKNVQAYLKDIDFFFKDARFELNVNDVSYYVNPEGKIFFRVTVNRNLQGITVGNDTVNSSQLRYIEINLNETEKQLKIASMYTTKLSEREELANWWNEIPYEWQELFKKEIEVSIDSVNFRMLKEMSTLERIDVSGNSYIRTLAPLSKLNNLKYLDVSSTAISDIIPLRNLTKLETLICSKTDITSLEPLKYSTGLKELIIDGTKISDISILTNFSRLETLNINSTSVYQLVSLAGIKDLRFANTAITSLDAISGLSSLSYLDCSSTSVKDLNPLSKAANLQSLNIEYSAVSDLSPLSGLNKLEVLICNNAPVKSLDPLAGLPLLSKIYCDNTPITQAEATRFMMVNTKVLVIYESEQLQTWWNDLDQYWKNIFSQYVSVDSLTREKLAEIANLVEIDISNKQEITSLEPLRRLRNLRKLNCANTSITSLDPLKGLLDLQNLDCSGTLISDLGALSESRNLRALNIDKTKVNSLLPLSEVNSMEHLSCEHTTLDEPSIMKFIREHPGCLVIYKSDELSLWWNEALSPAWKDAIRNQMSISGIPSKDQLHQIAFIEKLVISDNREIWDLSPISELVNLKDLELTNTAVSDLSPLSQMISLEKLVCARNPIKSLEPIGKLTNLKYLDFQDTPLEDLKPIRNLIELETLKCSGTEVSNLKHISSLINLKLLECFNTNVKRLKPLKGLYQLEKLVCYNTRVSSKEIENFKEDHPDCAVVYY